MRVVTLDFETAWSSKDYTLSKIGPIEYIRDDRFHPQMVAMSFNGKPAHVWRDVLDGLGSPAVALHANVDWQNDAVVAHNGGGFDFLILSEYFDIHPKHMWDTIWAMRWTGLSSISSETHKALCELLGTGEKKPGTVVSDGKKWPDDFTEQEQEYFTQYCADDVNQCVRNMRAMLPYMTDDALQFMSITARMATEPAFILDEQLLEEFIRQLDQEAEEARQKIMEVFHFENLQVFFKAIRSSQKFADMLRQLGVEPPTKYSPAKTASARARIVNEKQALRPDQTDAAAVLSQSLSELDRTGVSTYAFSKTDIEFLALREHDDPRVRLLVETRLEMNSSILRSRAETLLKFARQKKPIPIMLSAFKARTGRYSAGSSDGSTDRMQFQNLSKRNPAHLPLRRAIKVPDGYKVVAVDSSQVEARVLAYEANHYELLEHFRQGRDPYAELAVNFDRQYTAQAIHDGAKSGDKHCKQLRNVAKTLILACLAGTTQVLTNSGWKRIDAVTKKDKLWDGEVWVNHQGLICNGLRKTVNLDGVRMTPDHLIWDGTSWNMAKDYLNGRSCLSQAQNIGDAALLMSGWGQPGQNIKCNAQDVMLSDGQRNMLSSSVVQKVVRIVQSAMGRILNLSNRNILTQHQVQSLGNSQLSSLIDDHSTAIQNIAKEWWKFPALVGAQVTSFFCITWLQEKLRGVMLVPNEKPRTRSKNFMVGTPTFAQMLRIDAGSLIVSMPASIGVPTPMILVGGITEDAAYELNLQMPGNFWRILLHFLDGMTRCWNWTGLITRGIMQRVISALFLATRICETAEAGQTSWNDAADLKMKMPNCEIVYDIMNCGPHNRFLIKTDSGALLVHNCGYGTSAQKFSDTLIRQGMKLNPDVSRHAEIAREYHAIYRANNAPIVNFWRIAQSVIEALVVGGAGKFGGPNQDLFEYGILPIIGRADLAVPSIRMPNGYHLRYPGLRMQEGEQGRIEYVYDSKLGKNIIPKRLYGAGLVENLTQSLAFHILIWQACRMDDDGIALKGNNHDCWYTVVPEHTAHSTLDKMMWHMKRVPYWAQGCPIDCDGESGDSFVVC